MSKTFLRASNARQIDVIEWFRAQKAPLSVLRKEQYKMQKGFIAYGKDIAEFFRSRNSESKEKKAEPNANDQRAARAMDQHHQSQELLQRMKWKRATWEDGADYEAFSQRLLENDKMFGKMPAFSFMSIHVLKDPATANTVAGAAKVSGRTQLEPGSLTKWFTEERQPVDVDVYRCKPTSTRRPPYTVDWVAGEVKFLDTASPQEVLTFLSTAAPRLQALQVRMETEQTKLTEDVEHARVRLGITKLKYNEFDTSYWDDPKRQGNPKYISPSDLRQFLDGVLGSAILYRYYLKGHELRIVPRGSPYNINHEAKTIELPVNFEDFSWLPIHQRGRSWEKVANGCRRVWWLWFSLLLTIVGDLEVF